MEAQHKAMLKRLISGEFNDLAERLAAPPTSPALLATGETGPAAVNAGAPPAATPSARAAAAQARCEADGVPGASPCPAPGPRQRSGSRSARRSPPPAPRVPGGPLPQTPRVRPRRARRPGPAKMIPLRLRWCGPPRAPARRPHRRDRRTSSRTIPGDSRRRTTISHAVRGGVDQREEPRRGDPRLPLRRPGATQVRQRRGFDERSKRAAVAFAVALAACGREGCRATLPPILRGGSPARRVHSRDGGTADAGHPDGGVPDGGAQSCAFPPSSLLGWTDARRTAPGVPQPAALVGSCSDATLIHPPARTWPGNASGAIDAFAGTCTVTGANAGQLSCTARSSCRPGAVRARLEQRFLHTQVCIEGRDGGCSPDPAVPRPKRWSNDPPVLVT